MMTSNSSLTHASIEVPVKGEDAIVKGLVNLGDHRVQYFSVFDGHGGQAASRMCADHMDEYLAASYGELARRGGSTQEDELLAQAFTRAFDLADKDIAAHASKRAGTTATCVAVNERTHGIVVANVGDSSAYLFSPDGRMTQLTADHRVGRCGEAETKRLLEGGADIRQATGVSGKSVGPPRVYPGGLCVTRSIGDKDSSSAVTSEPSVARFTYPEEGGTIIVASDGVWDFIKEEDVMRLVRTSHHMGVVWLAESLIANVCQYNDKIDDVSLVCISLGGGAPGVRSPPRAAVRRISRAVTLPRSLRLGKATSTSAGNRSPPTSSSDSDDTSVSFGGHSSSVGSTSLTTSPASSVASHLDVSFATKAMRALFTRGPRAGA